MPCKVVRWLQTSDEIRGIFFVMNARKFKTDNHITVPGFAIVELGLSGNELLAYSLIYGFTQDSESEFYGSLTYVASALNVTRANAKAILDRLLKKCLISKRTLNTDKGLECRYVANRGVSETITGGVTETVTDNIYIDNIDDNIRVKEKTRRRTSENLCLFADSRFEDFDTFAAEFTGPEFADVDIVYYYHAVADWSASKGAKKRDWIATARNFIRADMERKTLHNVNSGGLSPDALKYLSEMSW